MRFHYRSIADEVETNHFETTSAIQLNEESTMQQILNVQGMTCGHCERAVTDAVKGIDPKAVVKIDRTSGKVEVESDSAREALAKAIVEEGYAVN